MNRCEDCQELRQLGNPVGGEQLRKCVACATLALATEPDSDGGAFQVLPPEAALRWIRSALHQQLDQKNESELGAELEALLVSLQVPLERRPELADQLASPDSAERSQAADCLGRIGPSARAAVPGLCVALHDEHPEVRLHAAWALGRIGGLTALTALLLAAEERPEPAIARALGRLAASAVQRLQSLLEHEQPAVSGVAAWALGLIGEQAVEAVSVLRRQLADTGAPRKRTGQDVWRLWERRVWALGRLGDAADVPMLIDILREHLDRSEVRRVIAGALVMLGAPAVEALMQALSDTDWTMRWRAAELLGSMGAAARPALPALKALRKDARPAVGEAAANSLKAIRNASKAQR